MKEKTAWLSPGGAGVLDDGDALHGADLAALVGEAHGAGAKVAYLLDPIGWDGRHGPEEWARAVTAAGGQWLDAGSTFKRAEFPRIALKRRGGHAHITLLRAALWVDEAEASHHSVRRVMQRLDEELKGRFRGRGLERTPGRTGAELWATQSGDEFAPLPDDLQQLVKRTSGQGRFECLPAIDPLPAVYELDRRFAYAACAAVVSASSEMRHEARPVAGWGDEGEDLPGWAGWTPGRYRVRFTVPAGWGHVGILGVYQGPRSSPKWLWPTEGRHECWCGDEELRLAMLQGWQAEVLERVLFVRPEGQKTFPRPLRAWAEKLRDLRGALSREADGDLFRAALRNIALHGIGYLAIQPPTVTRQAHSVADLPEQADRDGRWRELDDGTIAFEDVDPSKGTAPHLRHPELAAAVWSGCRARLLRSPYKRDGEWVHVGALALPREHLVGFAQDAIYCTHDPQWEDDRVWGGFKAKTYTPGPLPAPRSLPEMYRLVGKGAAGSAE